MRYRSLGSNGAKVFPIGLGCMSIGIADTYTSSVRSDGEAVALVHQALELGINLLDTADIYGDSERQVGRAIKGRPRDKIVLATKFGFSTGASANARRESPREMINGRREYVQQACEASLARLEVDYIDLYYLHRVDPNTPVEETVGAMADLVKRGKVRHIGLSEPAPATVRRAHKVHPLTAVQSEYSLFSRDPEEELLPLLAELGIALVAYSPLGRGFLAGRFRKPEDLAADDWRRGNPRFQGENFAKNLQLVEHLNRLAVRKGCTPAQLALAWLLVRHDNVIPIPGTSSVKRLEENVAAANIQLTKDELGEIDRIAPRGAAAGARYNEAMQGLLNG
jgi:aryl-alcohol dehydrogenase-like predicted oxidoreductase